MNKCLICENESFVSVKFVNEKGKTRILNLCKDCCKRFNIFLKSEKKRKNKECPFCGYTIDDFKEYRFLGCDFCYEYFYDEIIKYLKKIHTSIIYKGKYPKKFHREEKIKKFFTLKGFLIEDIVFK